MRRLAFALVAGLLASGAWAAEATRTLRMEWTRLDDKFAVENLVGTMKVHAGQGSAVVAVVTVHAESQALADSVRFEQVRGDHGVATLRVRYPLAEHDELRWPGGPRSWFGGHSRYEYDGHRVRIGSGGVMLYADVDVSVPARHVEALFRQHAGPVSGSGIQGDVRFDTSSGDISVVDVSGSVVADTGSGDVDARDVSGRFKCDTGSGDCELEGFSGERVEFDTGSGEITARRVKTDQLRADTGSGDVRLDDVDARSVQVDTGSGDVELLTSGDRLERVDADTGSGRVRLALPAAAGFEVRAEQGSGDLRSEFEDSEPIVRRREVVGYRRGDGRIRIDVDTGSGDVVLEPAGR